MKLGKINIVENVTVYAELTKNQLFIYVPKKKSRAVYFGDIFLWRTASKGKVLCTNINPISRLVDLQNKLQLFLEKGRETSLCVPFANSMFKLSKAEAHCLSQDISGILHELNRRGQSSLSSKSELHAG